MKRSYRTQQPPKPENTTLGLISAGKGVQLDILLEGFLQSRRGLSPRTIQNYREKLSRFVGWCKAVRINTVEEIRSNTIRDFFAELENHGNNPGGIHSFYRPIKTMLRWHEVETEFEYRSPMSRVQPPKLSIEPIPGVEPEEINRMIDACRGKNAKRDRAVIQSLFDTGARASELLALNIEDVNFANGAVKIKHGKGDKDRVVFIGVQTRRAIRKYLEDRENLQPYDPLFTTEEGGRITYDGLRNILRRRAEDAGMEGQPYPHDFRRAFALTLWRNGVDLVTISRLMGHSSLEVLKRYLAQNTDDLARAHAHASPVDTKLR